jgi:hypothetical protein
MTAPVDAASVQYAIRRALVVRRDTPRAEKAALAHDLAAYITRLLPAGRAAGERMWRGGFLWYQLTNRLDSIERQAATGLGDPEAGPGAGVDRPRALAMDTQWLMIRFGPEH